jgi:pimeloyl-ACP methyl ester carboxylesterase
MTAQSVVLLHGVWMPGSAMRFLRYYLRTEHGYTGHLFSYPSVAGTLDENADLLADFIDSQELTQSHLVGHSLGGVVALRMLARYPDVVSGRLVCLGSPLRGSRTASTLRTYRWGRAIVGKTLEDGVLESPASEWAVAAMRTHEVGSIAGKRSVGVGRVVASFDGDNDGTVAVAETRLPGLRDHLCMEVSHTGLVLSGDVAAQVAQFLKRGKFSRQR